MSNRSSEPRPNCVGAGKVKPTYIAIEGCIGAGKTTLALTLSRLLSAEVVLESLSSNPFLAEFYSQPAGPVPYAFHAELSIMLLHHLEMTRVGLSAQVVRDAPAQRASLAISDYLFDKALFYSRATLSGEPLRIARAVHRWLASQVASPDLLIFIDAPLGLLQERIASRGRPFEQGLSDRYLEQINGLVQEMYQRHVGRKIKVRASDLGTLRNPESLRPLVDQIVEALGGSG